jgi:hypothetical protein
MSAYHLAMAFFAAKNLVGNCEPPCTTPMAMYAYMPENGTFVAQKIAPFLPKIWSIFELFFLRIILKTKCILL